MTMMVMPVKPITKATNSINVIILWFFIATIMARKGGYPSPTAKTGPIGPQLKAFIKPARPTDAMKLPARPIQNCCWLKPTLIQYGIAIINKIKLMVPRLENARFMGSKPTFSEVRCFVHTECKDMAAADPKVKTIGTQ